MSDLIGQTLDSYRILTQVGRGGMATVYKAYASHLTQDDSLWIATESGLARYVPE